MIGDRALIESLVPQAGAMCLLDAVHECDGNTIKCRANSPDALHPFHGPRGVPAVVACEYGAQAAALHGAFLLDAQEPAAGMLAKIMDVEFQMACFPATGDVSVCAQMLSRVPMGCLYAFEVSANGHPVASGRLIVAFAQKELS